MMKHKFLSQQFLSGVVFVIIVCIVSSCGHKQMPIAEIIQTATLADLDDDIELLNNHCLVIFDVDDTLIQGTAYADRRVWKEVEECFKDLLTSAKSGRQKKQLRKKMYKMVPKLIEQYAPILIKKLQKRGVKVIALTSSSSIENPNAVLQSFPDYRIELLKSIGLDFSKAFPQLPCCVLRNIGEIGHHPIFKHGILFNQPCTKGQVLAEFLNTIQWFPRCIIFVDNDRAYIENVIEGCRQMKIPCRCYEYLGGSGLTQPPPGLFKFKVEFLLAHDEWLSDEKALLLMRT